MAASYIEALIPPEGTNTTNFRWNGAVGSAATVSYSFRASVQAYAVNDGTGFQQFTAAQKAAAEQVLDLYEDVCNLTFNGISTGGYSNSGQILFANNTQGAAGYAYFPSQYPNGSGGTTFHPLSGDIWINKAISANKTRLDPGESGFQTLLHEVGHALGLKHPFDPDGNHGVLPNATETAQFTVMSYTGHPHGVWRTIKETATGYSFTYPSIEPSTLMLYDIAALQYLYGKNMSTRTGNTTYTFDPDTPFLKCIWDAGGKDTISVANFTQGCEIDLRAGQFSSITILPDPLPDGYTGGSSPTYDGTDNLSIAYGARIENATGGSGKDRLTGNTLANLLIGNGGNDILIGSSGSDNLNGGAGNDTMKGGTGNDTYTVNAAGDVVTELSGQGADTVKSSVTEVLSDHVEKLILTGTGNINGTGNALANTLTGNNGNNILNGKGGADVLNGGNGDDTLVWALADTFKGGAGNDTLKFGNGDLDLAGVAGTKVQSVEIIDFTGASNNTLTVALGDVLAICDAGALLVNGNGGDLFELTDLGDWTLQGGAPETIGAVSYNAYQHNTAAAILKVDVDIAHV